MKKLIALDDGHGIDTSGKRTPDFTDGTKCETGSPHMRENEFNRRVVAILNTLLKRCNFDTLLVAPTDEDTPLETRVKRANDAKADFYVSVHANAFGTSGFNSSRGIETFYNTGSIKGKRAAELIHAQLIKNTSQVNRGVKSADFYVIKYTKMPAVLIEAAFMTNLEEAKLLLTESYRQECALEIAKGICEYFNVPFVEESEDHKGKMEYNQVVKERIYASGGKLIYTTRASGIKATDVRHIKFKTGEVEYKFVYEKGAKVSELVKKHNALFGINCSYFYNSLPLGYFHTGEKVISSPYGKMLKWHQFSINDGIPTIEKLNTNKKNPTLQGAPLLVSNGVPSWDYYNKVQEVANDIGRDKNGNLIRCQRTFIWVDKNNELHFGIADGRVSGVDEGLTLEEMSLYAVDNGAVYALNLDGGGSTILISGKDGALNQKENRDENERIVHCAILVLPKKKQDDEVDNPTKIEATPSKIDLVDSATNETLGLDGFLYEGKSYIELRKVADFFGAKVAWDDALRKATITK